MRGASRNARLWPLFALSGPALWALGFSLVYALHGLGCARGWAAQPGLIGSYHLSMLTGAVLAVVAVNLLALILVPRGSGLPGFLIVTGLRIGFGASLLTLAPALFLSSCG